MLRERSVWLGEASERTEKQRVTQDQLQSIPPMLQLLVQGVPQSPFLSLTTSLWSVCEAAPGAARLPGTVEPTDSSVPAALLKLRDRNNQGPYSLTACPQLRVLFCPAWNLLLPFPVTLAQPQLACREGLDQHPPFP